jgi:hypothetical protein
MPESLNEEAIFFGEVALLRELGGSFWRSTTVLQDVIDQGLFVVNVKVRGNDVVVQCSQICIGLRWIYLGHCRKTIDKYKASNSELQVIIPPWMPRRPKSRSAKSWSNERRLDKIWSKTFESYEYFLLNEKTWSKLSHGAMLGITKEVMSEWFPS